MAYGSPITIDLDESCHCVEAPPVKRRRPLLCVTKTARCGMTRDEYSCLLAIPGFRYRVKIPKKDIPNFEFTSFLWPISHAARNAECPQRNQELHDLGDRPKYFARENKVKKRHSGQGPFPGGHWATPGALTCPIKIRLTHLAVPRFNDSYWTKRTYGKLFTDRKKKLMDGHMDNAKKTVYWNPHKPHKKVPPKKSKADKYFRWPKKADQKKSGGGRIDELAQPRPIPTPDEADRGPKGGPNSADLDRLATPAPRYLRKDSDPSKVFKVKPGALGYKASDRINELAQPRPDVSQPPIDPFKVSEGAKHATASSRTEELAQPVKREDPQDDDVKEDPFKVNPAALKAKASSRVAELAEPRGS